MTLTKAALVLVVLVACPKLSTVAPVVLQEFVPVQIALASDWTSFNWVVHPKIVVYRLGSASNRPASPDTPCLPPRVKTELWGMTIVPPGTLKEILDRDIGEKKQRSNAFVSRKMLTSVNSAHVSSGSVASFFLGWIRLECVSCFFLVQFIWIISTMYGFLP